VTVGSRSGITGETQGCRGEVFIHAFPESDYSSSGLEYSWFLAFPPAGVGQAVFGNITGTVTDPTGAAVPNAEIAITDLDRGITIQTKTTSNGNFTQTHLLSGHYRVKVTAPGFSEFSGGAQTCR